MRDTKLDAGYNSDLDQHFLVNPVKIRAMISAVDPQPGDTVVELGAGMGTVSREVPRGVGLVMVELDGRLCEILQRRFMGRPQVRILQADACAVLKELVQTDSPGISPAIEKDRLKIISNLPYYLSDDILTILANPSAQYASAVIALRDNDKAAELVSRLESHLEVQDIELLGGDDFDPPQLYVSRVIRVVQR